MKQALCMQEFYAGMYFHVFPILSSSSINHAILQYLQLRELRFARPTKPATT